jgi:CelD/BcsL family acetyltransferase involved in cellulose biosynthesis
MHAEAASATAFAVRLDTGVPPQALAALAAGGTGCFFHTPAWMNVVATVEPRLRPVVLGAWDADGALRAACPLFETRRFGARFWYGGAWGTYGGIVGDDAEAVAAVRRHLLGVAPQLAGVRIHDFAGALGTPPGWNVTGEACQVLDLPAEPETLFRSTFTPQNRNKIRKAEKLGVRVRRAADAAALAAYAGLYRESTQRWQVAQAHPPGLFAALANVPGVDVWLAEQDGAAIAALLNFTAGGQVMNWGNVSRADAWSASPNNLLHWRALEAACRDTSGPRLYNFGASTGLPGVETFKAAFGARVRTHARLERQALWVEWLQRLRGR